MSWATLTKDIVAHEMDDEAATKHYPTGSILDVEDTDDGWFCFYPADDDIVYECHEEPDNVLVFDNEEGDDTHQVKGYQPVPNMTPKDKRLLL